MQPREPIRTPWIVVPGFLASMLLLFVGGAKAPPFWQGVLVGFGGVATATLVVVLVLHARGARRGATRTEPHR